MKSIALLTLILTHTAFGLDMKEVADLDPIVLGSPEQFTELDVTTLPEKVAIVVTDPELLADIMNKLEGLDPHSATNIIKRKKKQFDKTGFAWVSKFYGMLHRHMDTFISVPITLIWMTAVHKAGSSLSYRQMAQILLGSLVTIFPLDAFYNWKLGPYLKTNSYRKVMKRVRKSTEVKRATERAALVLDMKIPLILTKKLATALVQSIAKDLEEAKRTGRAFCERPWGAVR